MFRSRFIPRLPAPGSEGGQILFLSLLLTVFFLYSGSFYFPGGASQFTDYADALWHGTTLHPRHAQRDAGFPVLLALGLYPATGSFLGITLIFALMSAAMPLLVYGALARIHPRTAYWAALATIISLTPWQFIKFIHHDHGYLFFLVLTACFCARFVHDTRARYIYYMTFAAIACGLVRPAGNWMLLALLLGMCVLRPVQWKHYFACVIIFLACCFAYKQHREHIFDVKPGQQMPSYTGQQLFYNLYVNSAEYGILLTDDIGPNMHALMQKLRDAVSPDPSQSRYVLDSIAARNYTPEFTQTIFSHRTVDGFMASFYAHPNVEYLEMLSTIAQDDDPLFLRAAGEIARAYPLFTMQYALRNLYYMILRPGYEHGRDRYGPTQRLGKPYLQPAGGGVIQPHGVPERGLKEILHVPTEHELRYLAISKTTKNIWRIFYRAITWVSAFLMLAGIPPMLWQALQHIRKRPLPFDRESMSLFFLMLLIVMYNAAVTAAFVEPQYRYHYFLILPQIICAALSWRILRGQASVTTIPQPLPRKTMITGLVLIALWPLALYAAL